MDIPVGVIISYCFFLQRRPIYVVRDEIFQKQKNQSYYVLLKIVIQIIEQYAFCVELVMSGKIPVE